MKNNLFKLIKVAAILGPWIMLLLTINHFNKRYDDLMPTVIDTISQSYFVGCADAGFPDISECRDRAIRFIKPLKGLE